MSDQEGIVTKLLRVTFSTSPVAWFRQFGRIDTKEVGDDPNKPPTPNWLQIQVAEAVQWMLENKVPVRLILYKVRQVGCSTISVCVMYVLCRLFRIRCLVIAGEFSETSRVWSYLKTYGERDKFDWGNTWICNQKAARCSNGSEWERETAEDPDAGRAGGIHALLASEVAKWPTTGAKNAGETLTSLEAAIGEYPGTVEILESTAAGPYGPFPTKWNGAVTLTQMKAGILGNGFIRVFAPWFVFPQHATPLIDNEAQTLLDTIEKNGDEKAIEVHYRHNLRLEQTKWYHFTALEKCNKDPGRRDQEYPTTSEDGFAASMPSRFSKKGLAYLEKMARDVFDDVDTHHKLRFGILTRDQGAREPRIIPCKPGFKRENDHITGCLDPECNIVYLEGFQRYGCRYIIGVDNSLGKANAKGSDIDKNAVVLLRDGFMDSSANPPIWSPPEPVAILAPGNEWEQDRLAEFVFYLSLMMNKCMIAPEKNAGTWLIADLRKRGAPMIETPRNADEIDQAEGTEKYGWHTNKNTKPMLTAELAMRIREPKLVGSGIACRMLNMVDELRTFVKDPVTGVEGAIKITGCHDDYVLALGIAFMCRNSGTVYQPPQISIPIPPDIERLIAGGGSRVVRPVWGILIGFLLWNL